MTGTQGKPIDIVELAKELLFIVNGAVAEVEKRGGEQSGAVH